MAYNDFENSEQLGSPVELFEFKQGTSTFYFTTTAFPIIRFGNEYTPSPVSRDSVKQSGDIFKDSLKITFPRGDAYASTFVNSAIEEVTTVTVLRGHYGDADEEYITYWKGRIVGAEATSDKVTLQGESIFTSVQRPGLRERYELTCRHALYQTGCNVNREAFRVNALVTAVNSNQNIELSNISSFPNGWFTGGILLTPLGSSRFIIAHENSVITLSRPASDIEGNASISVYPGCDKLTGTCNDKFNNIENYGGFPFIPVGNNPFDGSSIV